MKYILLFGLLIITTMIMPNEDPKALSPVKVEILYNEDQPQKIDIARALEDAKSFNIMSAGETKKIEANIPQYIAQKEQTYINLEKLMDIVTENQQKLVALMKAHETGNKTIDQLSPYLEKIKNDLLEVKTETSTFQLRLDNSKIDILKSQTDAHNIIKNALETTFSLLQKQCTELQTQQKQQHDDNNQIMQAWMRKSQLFMTISVAVLAFTTSFWMWWHTHKI